MYIGRKPENGAMINKWICFPDWLWRQSICVLFPRDIFGHSRYYWGALDPLNLYCTPYSPEKNKKRIYLAGLRTPRPPQGWAGYHYGADWWTMVISRPNVIVTLSRSWVYLYLSWWISPRLMWVSIYTPKEHKADIPGQDRSFYDLITFRDSADAIHCVPFLLIHLHESWLTWNKMKWNKPKIYDFCHLKGQELKVGTNPSWFFSKLFVV